MAVPIALALATCAAVLLGLGVAHAVRGTRATLVGAIVALALAPVLGIVGTVARLVASFGAVAQVQSAEKAHVLASGIADATRVGMWGIFSALPLGILLVIGEQRRARRAASARAAPRSA